jgi:nucleoside-diphosphate-sugar epimerase
VKKNVAVFGGSGFVGQNINERFSQKEFDVTNFFSPLRFNQQFPYKYELVDFMVEDELVDSLRGFDFVIFCIGFFPQKHSSDNVKQLHLANSILPTKICLAAKLAGVKSFIFTSSVAVSLEQFNPTVFKDEYSSSKRAGELGLKCHSDPSFHVYCLRLGSVFGPDHYGTLGSLFNFARLGFLPSICSKDSQSLFVSVCDVVRFIEEILENGTTEPYRTFNLFYDDLTVEDFFQQISVVTGSKCFPIPEKPYFVLCKLGQFLEISLRVRSPMNLRRFWMSHRLNIQKFRGDLSVKDRDTLVKQLRDTFNSLF